MLETLKKLLLALQALLESLTNIVPPPAYEVPPSELPMNKDKADELYEAAFAALGTDPSKNGKAPQDRACAESLSYVVRKVYKNFPIILSTTNLNVHLDDSPEFKEIKTPIPGCISVFPTIGNKIGHTGIWGRKGWVMSNSSSNGLWEANYTEFGWKEEARKRGLPIYYYKPV